MHKMIQVRFAANAPRGTTGAAGLAGCLSRDDRKER